MVNIVRKKEKEISLLIVRVAAVGDSCRGGAHKEEVPRHRVASLSDVNKAVLLSIKPKIKHNAALLL